MKKSNPAPLVALGFAAVLLCAAACEPEPNARLIVKNELGFTIAQLSLTGDADTGDLLGGKTIAPISGVSDTGHPLPEEVVPGHYVWHVVFVEGTPMQKTDGSEEFELFPGDNHLVLTVAPIL